LILEPRNKNKQKNMNKHIITLLLTIFLPLLSFGQTPKEYEAYQDDLTKISVEHKSIVSEPFHKALQEEVLKASEAQKVNIDYWSLPNSKHSFYCGNVSVGAGDGTKSNPWNLYDALEGKYAIPANSTIYIEGGIYKRRPKERIDLLLHGEKNKPIVVRPKNNERVIIDGGFAIDYVKQDNVVGVWICGLEITISEPQHLSGSDVITRPMGGVWFQGGNYCRIIHNKIYRATGSGISVWSATNDTQVYGNVVYENGYVGSNRSHGHALYGQNKKPSRKTFEHNIFVTGPAVGFDTTYAFQFYGSPNSFVENCVIQENLFLGSVVIGRTGEDGSDRIYYNNNFQDKGGISFGYLSENNGMGTYRGNTMVGGSINIPHWKLLISLKNRIIANNPNRYIGVNEKKNHSIVSFPQKNDEFKFLKSRYLKNQYLLVTLDLNGDGEVSVDFSKIGFDYIQVFQYNRDEPIYSGASKVVNLKNFVTNDIDNGLKAVMNGYVIKGFK
jgi:parallel beta-helix repeat protein